MIKPECIGPVLIISLSKRYGGVDERVMEIASALHGRYPYAVVTLNGSPIHKRLVEANLVVLPLSFSRGSLLLLFHIWRAIHQHGCIVVDAHNVQSQFWGLLAAKLARVPVKVATVHSSYDIVDKGLKGWLFGRILYLFAHWKCHFIAVSESVYGYLQRLGIEDNQIFLVRNSIHLDEEFPPTRDFSVRESLGLGNIMDPKI